MYTMENHNSVLGIREYPKPILDGLNLWFQILGRWNGIDAFSFLITCFGQGALKLLVYHFVQLIHALSIAAVWLIWCL